VAGLNRASLFQQINIADETPRSKGTSMAGRKLTVVISQAPGKNPVKRRLEEEIATRLMLAGTAEVSVVPHLYDLTADHTGMLWLKSLRGNLVVLGWLFPRAIRWVLDRNGVKGKDGESRLNRKEDEDADDEDRPEEETTEPRGIGSLDVPNRLIYAIDLRNDADPQTYLTEIERLADLASVPLVQLGSFGGAGSLLPVIGTNLSQTSYQSHTSHENDRTNGTNGTNTTNGVTGGSPALPVVPPAVIGGDDVRRRWYPVIDYSRCTNCMECIDFCLFGVYGVDHSDRILVEEQDNCKKGCPACSRVCPVNAIIFPEHKTASIAGADGAKVEDFKIDLSKLFGAPSALEMAVLERDTELVADGREAVGAAIGLPKRQTCQAEKPRDALDDLMDGLDSLDL
jgi:NAD-dependent dihydropyrimidine dehydrogenase PreA subunit